MSDSQESWLDDPWLAGLSFGFLFIGCTPLCPVVPLAFFARKWWLRHVAASHERKAIRSEIELKHYEIDAGLRRLELEHGHQIKLAQLGPRSRPQDATQDYVEAHRRYEANVQRIDQSKLDPETKKQLKDDELRVLEDRIKQTLQ